MLVPPIGVNPSNSVADAGKNTNFPGKLFQFSITHRLIMGTCFVSITRPLGSCTFAIASVAVVFRHFTLDEVFPAKIDLCALITNASRSLRFAEWGWVNSEFRKGLITPVGRKSGSWNGHLKATLKAEPGSRQHNITKQNPGRINYVPREQPVGLALFLFLSPWTKRTSLSTFASLFFLRLITSSELHCPPGGAGNLMAFIEAQNHCRWLSRKNQVIRFR